MSERLPDPVEWPPSLRAIAALSRAVGRYECLNCRAVIDAETCPACGHITPPEGRPTVDPTIDEHERKLCATWLDRLVDKHGNPKDDHGRTALEIAAAQNSRLRYVGKIFGVNVYADPEQPHGHIEVLQWDHQLERHVSLGRFDMVTEELHHAA